MAADQFSDKPSDLQSPGRNAAAVTPNDSTDLTYTSRALFIGAAGTVSVITAGGQTVSFTCPAGAILPLCINRVRSTGTTATGIVAIW